MGLEVNTSKRRALSGVAEDPQAEWGARRSAILAGVLAIAVSVALVYSQSLGHEFVDYDDYIYFIDNAFLDQDFGGEDFVAAFTRTHQANWSPLTTLSIMLGDAVHGPDLAGYLLTNLVLHFLASALLFLALMRMTGAFLPSFWVGLVFAVHPLHVESVAWASERKDVLAGALWMACLLAYAFYGERPRLRRYIAVIALGILAALAKPSAVGLPLSLLLLDYWPLGRAATWRDAWPRLREKWPLFAVAILVSLMTVLAQEEVGANRTEFLPWTLRALNAGLSYWTYIVQTLWPWDLGAYYPYPSQELLLGWRPATAWVLGLLATVAVLANARSRPYLAVGWFWFVLLLVPMIGFVQVGGQAHADRYMYVPMAGLLMLLAWGVAEWGRPGARAKAAWAAALVAAMTLAGLARQQVTYWADSVTLFERAIAVTGPNALPRQYLGVAYWIRGEFEEGEKHLRAAVEISPHSAAARLALADALNQTGRHREARSHLLEARSRGFSGAALHAGLGVAAQGLGDDRNAAAEYRRALGQGLDDWEVKNNLAWLLATSSIRELRDAHAAVALAQEALESAPGHPQLLETLAAARAAAQAAP